MASIFSRNSRLCVFTSFNSSCMNDRLICLFMDLLYHFFHVFSRPLVLCGVAFRLHVGGGITLRHQHSRKLHFLLGQFVSALFHGFFLLVFISGVIYAIYTVGYSDSIQLIHGHGFLSLQGKASCRMLFCEDQRAPQIATRFYKLACGFFAFNHLAAALLWLS